MIENSQTAAQSAAPANQFAALKQPVPPQDVKQREGWRDKNGNAHLVDYLEWHTVADILDEHAPDWSHAVKDIREMGEILVVTVAVTIGGITREGIGTGAAGTEVGIKKAEHDALKRAAVKFGVGRELYKKESALIEAKGAAQIYQNDGAAPLNPLARSMSDMATPKQIGMVRSLARENRVDAETVCGEIWNDIGINELSKKAASYLISHLQELPETASAPLVETGIPSEAPEKPKTNVREMPVKQAVVQTAPSSPARIDSCEAMRLDIIAKFGEVKKSPDASLAAFDRERDLSRQKDVHAGIMNFIVQVKRDQILEAIQNSKWELHETDAEFKKFGITELRKAAPAQVGAMWADYKKDGQI